MKYRLLPAFALALGLIFTGCDRPADDGVDDTLTQDTMMVDQTQRTAVAELEPTEGNEVRGTVTFTEEGDGVRVVATLTGLEAGPHGFHVHEFGDCSAPDASSAGGHFAPLGNPHGAPDAAEGQRHVGDLGNIEADDTGSASYDRVDNVITLDGERSIIGKAVVVHSQEDDFETQPTGDAGDRLACGVIESSNGAAGQQTTPGMNGMQQDTTGMMNTPPPGP